MSYENSKLLLTAQEAHSPIMAASSDIIATFKKALGFHHEGTQALNALLF